MSKVRLKVPTWAATIYTIFAVILVPWTVYLAISLPERHLSRHWDVAWVGLDVAIMISLLATGFYAKIKSSLVILSATITATLLIVDAWFDVISSKQGPQLSEAIILAIVIEIPLAIGSFVLALTTLRRNT